MGGTITGKLQAFRKRPHLGTFVQLIHTTVRQGRAIEAAYGASQFLVRRPSSLRRRSVPTNVMRRAEHMMTLREADVVDDYRSQHALLARWIPDIGIRAHSVARCGDATIVGEYCEAGAKLFLLTDDRMTVCDHYCREQGVRHIHFVYALDDKRFLVSTGDSKRVLDLWRVDGTQLRFERRLIRNLAGFTGIATVRGETYLGSDFSSRPNYLLRLRDRRKFFLPRESFLRYVWIIEPVDDRYLIVGAKALALAGGGHSVSIFDGASACFVEPR